MISSLRWRLQLWHALILASAVMIFAGAFHHQLRRGMFREIDAELLSGARMLQGTLQGMPPEMRSRRLADARLALPSIRDPGPQGLGGPRRRPPSDGWPGLDPSPPPQPSRDDLPRVYVPPPPPRSDGDMGFDVGPPRRPPFSPPYFAIFDRSGSQLFASPEDVSIVPVALERPLAFRDVEKSREALLRGPEGTLIIVGRDISRERQRLAEWFLQLVGIGVAVVGLGLVGGWWLAGRAIAPIDRICRTAQSITAQNLAERIETSRMDAELKALGGILNSMFARLEDSFERQTRFTADASHELRTPLSILIANCELGLRRQRTVSEYQQTLDTCHRAAERMRELVDGLLTLARADAGKLELKVTDVDLRKVAADTVNFFEAFAAEHQIALQLGGDAARCRGDAARLAQVVGNLVHNAISHGGFGCTVSIITEQTKDAAIVKVRDTGPGIPPEDVPRLFERFYRVDQSRKRSADEQRKSGSGLGLAICKSIVEAHGGTLSVHSQLGSGSTFEVRLPSAMVTSGGDAGETFDFR